MKPLLRSSRRCARLSVLVLGLFIFASPGTQAQGVVNAMQKRPLVKTQNKADSVRIAAGNKSRSEVCAEQFVAARNEGKESFGCVWKWLGLDTSEEADQFFGGFEVGNSIALRLGEAETSMYTELLSDNLYLAPWAGYARLGFATQVAAAQNTADADAQGTVDQFFQGGGNAMLYFALPAIVWINYAVDTARGPVRQFTSLLTLAFTGDVPKLGTAVSESAGSFRAGTQADFTWRTHNERLGLFFNLRGNYVRGFSDAFYRNLRVAPADVPAEGMFAGDYTIGVDLSKLIRVGVSGGVSTLKSVSTAARLSVQLLDQE